MTGPEHYQEAERLLAQAHIPSRDRAQPGWLTADELVAEAAVHATLAQAAAFALAGNQFMANTYDFEAWREAASAMPEPEVPR